MSAKKGKSVIGDGDEFSWVPNSESSQDKETKGQGDKSTSRPVAKSPSRKKKESTQDKKKPEDKTLQKIGVYLKSSTVFALKTQALKEGRSASAIVQDLVSEYCAE